MHLYLLLAGALWASWSHPIPLQTVPASPQENHTAICAEIQKELLADHVIYDGFFSRPQNTSEESCYGKFTQSFISTLKKLFDHHKNDHHINKIYKDMEELTQICPKLKPTESPKNCTIEQSNFSRFKEALQSVVTSIEGWKSCKRNDSSLWDPVLSWEPGAHG